MAEFSVAIIAEEVWKPISSHEGLYEISNLGRVKSLEKKCGGAVVGILSEKILKHSNHTCGYLSVSLCKNGKAKPKYVHRLVADAFLEKDDSRKCVNHKDGNKKNNYVDNLEWCTYRENNLHAYRTGIIKKETSRKPVLQFTLLGKFIREFPSILTAAKKCNGRPGGISACCYGKNRYAHGYTWKFKPQT